MVDKTSWNESCVFPIINSNPVGELVMKYITPVLGLMLFGLSLTAQAIPMGYDFSQDGFDEGASVTGMFVAEDSNNNGQISSFNGEVSDFMMSFSGNSLVSAFSLDITSLFGLVYDLDGTIGDGLILDIEGIGADDFQFSYAAGPGPLNFCNGSDACGQVSRILPAGGGVAFSSSNEIVQVIPKSVGVPEPSTLALLSLGFLGIGAARKLKKHSQEAHDRPRFGGVFAFWDMSGELKWMTAEPSSMTEGGTRMC